MMFLFIIQVNYLIFNHLIDVAVKYLRVIGALLQTLCKIYVFRQRNIEDDNENGG